MESLKATGNSELADFKGRGSRSEEDGAECEQCISRRDTEARRKERQQHDPKHVNL